MIRVTTIRVWKPLCCALAAALVSSCSDPQEMLDYQKDTERLKEVVRDFRQDVQRASDELRKLQAEKRNWEKDTELDELRAEAKKHREARDAAMAELSAVVEEFETMKETRLP